jgi:hypothetical protein
MKTGISRNVEEWKQQWLAEGMAKGKSEALLCLLAERFGALTPNLRNRVSRAKLATVDRWFKRAIVAADLDSVFAPRRS